MGLNARLPGQNPVFISSWKGFRSFIEALEQLGAEQFPTIIAQLPDGDEGVTSAENAIAMLGELHRFLEQEQQVQQAVLVDSERGGDISMGSNVLGGALSMDRVSGYDLGFNADGFFVRDRWELNRILFQAMRVEQVLLNPEQHQVEYRDRDNPDHFFLCNTPFGKPMNGDDGIPRMMLRHFHVELRPAAPNRYAYITGPLLRVLEEAVEQRSVVEWI